MSNVRSLSDSRDVRAARRRSGLLLLLAAALLAGGLEAQVWEVGEQGLVLASGPQAVAQYGQAVASGDFNDDGFRDLAVGAPLWDNGPEASVGRVEIFLGSSSGLTSPPVVFGGSFPGMWFGQALVAGNFDSDAADELAIGAPGFDVGAVNEAGRVFILNYSAGSWSFTFWDQEVAGVPGVAEPGDRFGYTLAAGDFDNDGFEDLVVGLPYEDATLVDSGALIALYGSAGGLTSTGALLVLQADVLAPEQTGAQFAAALAAGDFTDDDLFLDLAVGCPGYPVDGLNDSGGVAVLFGGASGLSTAGRQVFDHGDFGGTVQTGDEFGYALAAGDFNRTNACWSGFTCRTDLAIGVPGQPISGAVDAGQVVIGYGGAGGIQIAGSQLLDQGDLSPLASIPEAGDRFGSALQAEWFFGRNLDGPATGISADDLVIGVPAEQWAGVDFQGIVHLVFGDPAGLNSGPGQYRLADPGLSSGPPAAFDNFGRTLAIGDFDGDDWADLAIGVIGRDAGASNSGIVQVLFGALFADGFESAATGNWSSDVATLGAPWAPLVDDATSAEERAQ